MCLYACKKTREGAKHGTRSTCVYMHVYGCVRRPETAPDTAPAAAPCPAPAAACTTPPAPPTNTLAAAAACALTAPAACAPEDRDSFWGSFLAYVLLASYVLLDATATLAGDGGTDGVGGRGYEAARARATLEATRLYGHVIW